jgi:hypothetical protein
MRPPRRGLSAVEDRPFVPAAEACEHCGRQIRRVRTRKGNLQAVNAAFDRDRGNIQWLRNDGFVVQLGAEDAKVARSNGVQMWVYHGVDCAETRRRGAAARADRPPDPPERPTSVASPRTRAAAIRAFAAHLESKRAKRSQR